LEDANYRQLFDGDKPVLVDACAKWCGPCKLIEPVLKRCAQKRSDLIVGRFDIEGGHDELKVELLLKGVMPRSLPSLILFHKNQAITIRKGVITDDQLEAFLLENMPQAVTPRQSPRPVAATNQKKKAGSISFASQVDDYMLVGS
jgi:thioredoxin 1